MFTSLFTWLGTIAGCYLSAKVLRFIYLYTRPSSLKRYHHGGEPWALITGSSDGIGFAFARALAKNGFNIVLHGRNLSKLETRKTELLAESPKIQVRILVADALALVASKPGEDALRGVIAQLEALHLTVLINNIGGVESIMYPAPRALEQTTAAEADALLNLNIRFPMQITRALLPALTKHHKPSLIINVGSAGGHMLPYASIYSGAKAFNMSFSRSLRFETRSEGQDIEVLGIVMGPVTDVSFRKHEPSLMVPRASDLAEAALARVGCGRAVVAPWFWHGVQLVAMDYLPEGVAGWILIRLVKEVLEEQSKGR